MSSLVAGPRTIEQSAFAGAGLLEDIDGACTAIQNGEWVEAGLNAGAVALGTVAAVVDPIGTALSAGVGWVIEHLDPLKDWLQKLTGDDEAVAGFADTWVNISEHLDDVAQRLATMQAKIDQMSGQFIDAVYKELGTAFDSLASLSRVSSAVGVGFEIASSLVGMVYALVRDAIADIVAKTLVWVAELALTVGLGTPVVIAQVVTTVSDWVGRTFPSMKRLTDSIVAFQDKARSIQETLERVTNVLGDRAKSPNAIPAGADPIRRGANWVAGEAMSQDTVLEHLFTTQSGNNFKDFENILKAVDTSSLNLGKGIMETLTPKADIGTLRSVIAMLYEDGQSGAARQLERFL